MDEPEIDSTWSTVNADGIEVPVGAPWTATCTNRACPGEGVPVAIPANVDVALCGECFHAQTISEGD